MKKVLFFIGCFILLLSVCLVAAEENGASFMQDKSTSYSISDKKRGNSDLYTKEWKEIDELIKKDLPRSVVEVAGRIYLDAMEKRNLPQMMKAFMVRAEYQNLLSPDSADIQIKTLKEWASAEEDIVARAVLNNILGQIAAGKSPADVSSALEYFRLSLTDKNSLISEQAENYYPVVISGKTSREFFDDNMYDFLARQSVKGLLSCRNYEFQDSVHNAISDIYDSLVEIYRGKNIRAEALAEEARILYLADYCVSDKYRISAGDAIKELLSLSEKFRNSDVYCDISLKLAGKYISSGMMTEAMNVVKKALDAYPHSEWEKDLEGMVKYIESPSLSVEIPFIYPEYKSDMKIWYKNLSEVSLEVFRTGLSPVSDELNPQNKIDFEKIIKRTGNRVSVNNYSLPATDDYKQHSTEVSFTLPDAGIYILKLYSREKKSEPVYQVLYVSPYQCVMIPLSEKKKELVAVDRLSGQPVPHAEIVSYISRDNKFILNKIYTTDGNGCVTVDINDENLSYINVRTPGNDFMPVSYSYNYYRGMMSVSESGKKEVERTTIFTDRSIYRPGQKVHVSGVKYVQCGDSVSVVSGSNIKLVLTDSNGRKVSEKSVTTDNFGVYSSEFVLPREALPGNFGISDGNSYSSVRVEEYKRPTFDIVFSRAEKSFTFGDSVKAEAKVETFSGAPVGLSKVSYRVTRSEAWWWRMSGYETELLSGETMTGADGSFSVDFLLEKPGNGNEIIAQDNGIGAKPFYTMPFYRYKVKAKVTGPSGETHEGEFVVSVGDKSLGLQINGLSDRVAKERIGKIQFAAVNMDNMPVKTDVEYSVYSIDDKGNRKNNTPLASGKMESQLSFVPDFLNDLPSGKYSIEIMAKDDKGRVCTHSDDFILFSLEDKRPPVNTVEWFYQDGSDFDGKNTVDVYIGSSEDNVYLMKDEYASGKRISRERIVLSDSIVRFSYRYKEEYGDGLSVMFTFMRKGELYRKTVRLLRPQPEKKLDLSWMSFRDNLIPGQNEEWILNIKDKNGNPVMANLLASAYDASLDRLWGTSANGIYVPYGVNNSSYNSHNFNFGLYFGRNVSYPFSNMINILHNASLSAIFPNVYYTDGLNLLWGEDLSRFIPFTFYSYRERYYLKGGASLAGYPVARAQMKNAAVAFGVSRSDMNGANPALPPYEVQQEADVEESVVASEESSDVILSESGKEVTGDGGMENSSGSIPENLNVRENFSETAFFYPGLKTDSLGNVRIPFVMPDALTEWRFNGFAHTRSMEYGHISAVFSTSKPFMVQPNMPRFVRVGDKSSVSASLVNMSMGDIKGDVRMVLTNPMNGKVIFSKTMKFSVGEGETGAVTFVYEVTEDADILECSIVAAGEAKVYDDKEKKQTVVKFSDGERHYLPVISGKQWITESIPVQLSSKDSVRIISVGGNLFNNNSQTATNRMLTVDMTANPQWYVIEALPVLASPVVDDAFSWASALYSNALSLHLVKSSPGLRKLVELWKSVPGNDFWSELGRNEELKNIVLTETPWVAASVNDSERKQRIALLLDENGMNNRLATVVGKLSEMQLSDGAWPWFNGMTSSRYITTRIVELIARMKAMGISFGILGGEVDSMYYKALKYLKSEVGREYMDIMELRKRKGENASYSVSDATVSYLYICAIDKSASEVSDSSVNKFMTEYFVGKSSSMSIYMKSVMSFVMEHSGYHDEAANLLKSLMEYLVYSDDMGYYFDTPKADYSFLSYRIPTHVAVMEAISAIGAFNADKSSVAVESFSGKKAVKDGMDIESVLSGMQLWLLKQKQVQVWDNPISSVNAIYAFLKLGAVDNDCNEYNGSDDYNSDKTDEGQNTVGIDIACNNKISAYWGNDSISTPEDVIGNVSMTYRFDDFLQNGFNGSNNGLNNGSNNGFYNGLHNGVSHSGSNKVSKKNKEKQNTSCSDIKFVMEGKGFGWVSVYAQYLEDIDKVGNWQGEGLQISRKYLLDGKEVGISDSDSSDKKADGNLRLKVGDKLTVLITVKADRDMDFVCIKDSKPACVENVNALSGYGWGYYAVNRDVTTEFYIDRMTKGEHVYKYDVYISRSGIYSAAPASVVSVYAPQFGSHTSGAKFDVSF